jgi:fructose-1,6-bisphosphatase/inositol monophosphatase family enzyme
MPQSINPQKFIDLLLPVVRQCAQASLIFYGQVANIGKAADTSLTGDHAQTASEAFTVLDVAVQDLILSVVLEHFPGIACIAEEKTPLKRRFAANQSEYTLILDPIDGTFHFQRGDAPYHICVGLAKNGKMLASIIARPTEDKFFTAVHGQGAYLQQGKRTPRRLHLGKKARTNKMFISSKARNYQQAVRPELDPNEYPIGAALVLTQVATGELCAYLTRQIEVYDVGPPSLIATEAGARCYLKNGQVPRYHQRRKFSHFICTADEAIAARLFEVVRMADRTEKRTEKRPIKKQKTHQ